MLSPNLAVFITANRALSIGLHENET